jgi:hypothetical protein
MPADPFPTPVVGRQLLHCGRCKRTEEVTHADLMKYMKRGWPTSADVAIAVLDEPSVQQMPFIRYEKAIKKLADRMAEHGLRRLLEQPLTAGGLQRTVLAAPAGYMDRPFRIIWEYVDRTDGPPPGTSL